MLHANILLSSLTLLTLLPHAIADVTIYAQPGTAIAFQPQYTPCIGAVPCDGNVLSPIFPSSSFSNDTAAPPVIVNNTVPVQLYTGGMTNMSMPVPNHFFGFSLELSVVNRLFGGSPETLDPVFLNLLATVIARSKNLVLRVGGNTQEQSVLVPDGLNKGAMLEKGDLGSSTTQTPALLLSPILIYAMSNISSLLPKRSIKWFLGAPFNDTQNPRPELVELAYSVLGRDLVGIQLGNEPDLYHQNGIRGGDYTPEQYDTEWGQVVNVYKQVGSADGDDDEDGNDDGEGDGRTIENLFVAPSVCCGGVGNIGWTPEMVWDTGFLDHYKDNLAYIAVQHYPSDNCNGTGTPNAPQQLLPQIYLNHGNTISQTFAYLNTSAIARSLDKPLVLFETNTASCGGFSGLSDSFAAALWAVDYALAMATANFSHVLFHVGGVGDYYNPFTPPSTNQSHFRQWTIGSTFYASLVVSEALSSSSSSSSSSGASGSGSGSGSGAQVVDLFLNENNAMTPGYAIYEEGNPNPARVVLMNFVTDDVNGNGTGTSANYTAYLSVGGNATGQEGATPSSVKVKYLLSSSVTEKFDITWAGQTFGGPFASDGRLQGSETIYTYTCDTANNVCAVPVPAPGLALVFLSDNALDEVEGESVMTFATTATPSVAANTATVDQAVLATSNGRGGGKWDTLGSTSYGSVSSASPSSPSPSSRLRLGSIVSVAVVILCTILGIGAAGSGGGLFGLGL